MALQTIVRILAGATLCAACAGRATPPVPAISPDERCIVGSGGRDTVVVALEEPVRSDHAPAPATDSERLAFRQRYETLIGVDCAGRVQPGLAEEWGVDSSGTVWTFRLAARVFGGGDTLTAGHVIESWNQRYGGTHPALSGITARDARTLVVVLRSPLGVAAFADPALAVTGPRSSGGWPEGTGPMRPAIMFRMAPGTGLLDLLTQGIDLAVTRDADAIAYAERLEEFMVTPLPEDRTYILASTSGAVVDAGRDSLEQLQFRSELARDVVTAAARAAEPLPSGATPCRTQSLPSVSPLHRIVYPRGDRTARELAERIVALGSRELTLEAADASELHARLLNGADQAYVLVVPRAPPVSCAGRPVLPRDAAVTPLVDTRAHLILRRGAARVEVASDGIPRILAPDSP